MRRAVVLAGLILGGGLTMAVAAWQTPPAVQSIDVVEVKDGTRTAMPSWCSPRLA